MSVLAWLLPLFSVLSIGFILCLPFSGLRTLWSTGQASTLMLLIQFGTLILVNAAWLDGSKPAFKNKFVNVISQISLLCLPVYFVLCLYSVGLRIEQYGLSTDRVQAMFLVVVTGIWGLGYAGAVLFRKWPSSIGGVNIISIAFMIIIVAAMNSPLLDPYKLAAFNQLERLQTGKISAEDFDYIYTRFNLGRYGNKVLNTLKREGSPAVKRGIEAAMSVDPLEYLNYTLNNIPPVSRRTEIISRAKVYPKGAKLSDDLIRYFILEWQNSLLLEAKTAKDAAFVFLDVEKDAHNLILFTENSGTIYKVDGSKITPSGIIRGNFNLDNLDMKIMEPKFFDVQNNGKLYQILRLQ